MILTYKHFDPPKPKGEYVKVIWSGDPPEAIGRSFELDAALVDFAAPTGFTLSGVELKSLYKSHEELKRFKKILDDQIMEACMK